MKQIAFIIAIACGLTACGNMAPKNPLGASIAPTPTAYDCPSRYNFEGALGLGGWSAPSWAGGFTALSLSGTHTACGLQALKTHFQVNGTNQSVLLCALAQGEDLTGRVVSANIYYAQKPPSDLQLVIYFMDRSGNWRSPPDASHYGMRQGWNVITETFNVPGYDVSDMVEIIFQWTTTTFSANKGVAYAGDVWVDEINW